MRLFDRLSRPGRGERFALLVSLPANDPELARAAIDGGAHGLKVHLNVEHRASGTRFGTLAAERGPIEAIAALARSAGVAIGIMPGATTVATLEELSMLVGMGFEFMDFYGRDLPAQYLTFAGLRKVFALADGDDLADASALGGLPVDAIEASIVPGEGYGRPLSAADLWRYAVLIRAAPVPVLVPTQRRVTPAQVPLLAAAGVAGLMIGAVVTGREPGPVRESTAAFRAAVDALGGGS